MTRGITLEAILSKIATTVDGGWNITFSVGQDQVQSIMQLSELRDTNLTMALVPEPKSGFLDG